MSGQKPPFISIVITVRNAASTMGMCLDSLLAQEYPKDCYEIVIVDAFSTDQTQDIIKDYAKNHKEPKISLYEKAGYIGAGRNEGIKKAKGEFIAVTDADMEVSPQWLSEHISSFEDDVAGVGGPNNNPEDILFTNTISCLDIHGPCQDVVPLRGKNRYSEPFKSRTDIYTTVCRNSCFRKKVLEEISLFDERLVATEDPELNQRILKAGWALRYNPKALVYHHHRTKIRAFFKQQSHYAFGQAVANVIHPQMYKLIQPLPLIGAIALLVMLALSPFVPIYLILVLIALAGYSTLYLAYGIKCAKIKGDPRLIFSIPVAVVVWHSAWVFGYLRGLIRRKAVLSEHWAGIESHA